jgi:DNA-binding MarR family transcriptional regulator
MSRSRPNRSKLSQQLDEAMRKASAQGVLFSQLVARRLGINSTDLECLDVITLRGSVTAGELAAATGLTTGAVTGVIDRLEQSGFALRERDESDRRKVLVRALPAVERRITPLFEPMQRAMSAAIAGYGENELALLIDFLIRVHEEAVTATESLQTKAPRRVKRDRSQPN